MVGWGKVLVFLLPVLVVPAGSEWLLDDAQKDQVLSSVIRAPVVVLPVAQGCVDSAVVARENSLSLRMVEGTWAYTKT